MLGILVFYGKSRQFSEVLARYISAELSLKFIVLRYIIFYTLAVVFDSIHISDMHVSCSRKEFSLKLVQFMFAY